MRISCNGCRVLRKGCNEGCSLRACVEWLKSAEAQANATLFLAKFYGRAGLINLIDAGPTHLRPEIFMSLLYEACGRIINPVYGSVGLMISGDWPRCQAAVDSVLGGCQLAAADDSSTAGRLQTCPVSPLHGCDIRHIFKGDAATSLHRVRTRNRRRRSSSVADSVAAEYPIESEAAKFIITRWDCGEDLKDFVIDQESERTPSHDSLSVETVEPSLMNFDDPPPPQLSELGLELTLGLNPVLQTNLSTVIEISDSQE